MHLSVLGTAAPVKGEVLVPNSKYHAHRALILASLAPGVSRIRGLTDARHVQYTVGLLRGLGTRIDVVGDTFVVEGGPYRPRRESVSAGSSGTTLYFMVGLASFSESDVVVTGQKYFQRRPIGPLLSALRQMGADVSSPDDCPPIHVRGQRPTGGDVHIAGTLSQWISGLILLAPFATGPTTINVEGEFNERTYIELTVSMMRQFGLHVSVSEDWRRYEIEPNQVPVPTDLVMPPDIGSAAFGLAAAALQPADVVLHGLRKTSAGESDHPESDFLDIVSAMGLPMAYDPSVDAVRVRHDGLRLSPIEVDCRTVPDMLPILSTLATFAEGESVFRNVAHVRLKESDRVAAMLQLNSMGGDLRIDGNDLRVRGVRRLLASDLSSFNDHRVLMSLAVAASAAEGRSTLTYPNAYRISYPEFLTAMNSLGLSMRVEDGPVRRPEPKKPAARAARENLRRIATQRDVDAAAAVPASDWVRRWAAEKPNASAVVAIRPRVTEHRTWAELDERADRIATLLTQLGVRAGDRVAVQLPNRAEFVGCAVAAARIGAVIAPIMPIFREREVSFALRRSQASVVILPASFRGRRHAEELASILQGEDDGGSDLPLALRHVVVISDDGEAVQAARQATPAGAGDTGAGESNAGEEAAPQWHDWDEALAGVVVDREALDALAPDASAYAQLLFTSGTSGEPKGVLQRHSVLSRAAAMEARHLGLTGDDTIYIPSPLAHQTGFLYGMWLAFVLGAPQVVQEVWDAQRALDAMQGWRATFVQAATPFLMDLLKKVEETGQVPQSLRIFVATGAAVPRALAERATRVLGTAVCGAFGTTETCLGALATPADEPVKMWGTDGRMLDGVKLRIVTDDGQPLPPGVEGNFELSSPTMFEGYLDRPDLTAAAFTEDGWYRTGDLGIIDDAGFLRITGRVRDVINRGGEKIPVAEIEQLLFEHPLVEDVALAAFPDERLGERACAFVVPAQDGRLTFEGMQAYLDAHQVSKHYWPERLEIVDSLPRNAVGKIQKYLLREQARNLTPQRTNDGGSK